MFSDADMPTNDFEPGMLIIGKTQLWSLKFTNKARNQILFTHVLFTCFLLINELINICLWKSMDSIACLTTNLLKCRRIF